MVKKLCIAAAAALALTGCNGNDVELSSVHSGDKVQLTVRIPEGLTKVTGTPTDAQVKDIQVFVFDRHGVYETASHGSGSSLSVTCTSGEKQIVALINAPLETGVSDISGLRSRISDLTDCTSGSVVMSGELVKNLTASSTVNMEVERIAAKVAISRIHLDFEQEQHRQLPFTVKAIYLINVAGDRSYLTYSEPEIWYNKMRNEEDASYMISSSTKLLLKYDKELKIIS